MTTRKNRGRKSKIQANSPLPKAKFTRPSESELAAHMERVKERMAALEKMRENAVRDQPGLAVLRDRLLEHGGERVVFVGPERDLDVLLEHGAIFTTEGLRMRRGERGRCHTNAARLWWKSRGRIRIATGYALHEDGLWRAHSRGLQDGRIIETTVHFQISVLPESRAF
jgi:hypothetical protein